MTSADWFTNNPTSMDWQTTGVNVLGYPPPYAGMPLNTSSSQTLDYMNAANWFQQNPTSNPANMGLAQPGIGAWIQKNSSMLIIGGIVGLLLFRRG
jgi:hypothetical protein